MTFALGSFRSEGQPSFCGMTFAEGGVARVVALKTLLEGLGEGWPAMASHSLLSLFDQWDSNLVWLRRAREFLGSEAGRRVRRFDLSALHVDAPHVPRQILCVGANYRTHVIDILLAQPSPRMAGMAPAERRAEAARMMDERAATGTPYAFSKLPSCVLGPYDSLVLPHDVMQPDWELELAVVIGRPARHVDRANAMNHVAGFGVANDVTARERVYRADIPDLATDFLAGKSCPGFLPFGPWITPRDFVDHRDLTITLRLNGETMQNGHTADMVFDVPRQIEYLSNRVQLWAGDVICTGSPAGNGMHHRRFLRPGDELDGSITGLGSLHNRCMAE